MFKKLFFVVIASFTSLSSASAEEWGFSVGYNNPAGARYGLNLISFSSRYAFEVGVGSAFASSDDDTKKAGLAGDIDFKILFSNDALVPYAEVGVGVATSTKVGDDNDISLGAANPFAGGGLMYKWHTPFAYVGADYGFSSKKLYPFGGLGFRF